MHLKLLNICDSFAQELLSMAWFFFFNLNYKSIKIEETPQQSPIQSSPIFSLLKRLSAHSQGRIRWHLHLLIRISVSLHFQLEGFAVPPLIPLLSSLCEASLPKACPVFLSAYVNFLHSQYQLKSCKSSLWHEESPPFPFKSISLQFYFPSNYFNWKSSSPRHLLPPRMLSFLTCCM